MQVTEKPQELCLKGVPISGGIAIGHLHFCSHTDDTIVGRDILTGELEAEILRYREALTRGKNDLLRLLQLLNLNDKGESAAILEAHLHLLDDPALASDIELGIRRHKKNAEFVLHETLLNYRSKFNAISSAHFRERFHDMQAIIRRILDCLKGEIKVSYSTTKGAVVYARELSVVDLTEASISLAKAFIAEVNGVTSHAAIAAKAKGIPFVTSISQQDIELLVNGDATIIVDGNSGYIYINPSEETLKLYEPQASAPQEVDYIIEMCGNTALLAETYDGYRVNLSANIEMAAEVNMLHAHGGEGVGLFRTEYAFLSHMDFPSEEEQFKTYKEAVTSMRGLPIVIRAFDLGGDKYFLSQKVPFENNPFLGCRAIRFLLKERNLFKEQLKALVHASAFGDVSIMLPMISSLQELLETKELLQQAHKEVEEREEMIIKPMRLGCMIEVPSAALMCDLLAKECDFLSIGTNDLVQYALAVDRGNQALSGLYLPTHPCIIRLIKLVVSEANGFGIPVSICGEMAANPRFTALLLGLGVHELSVSLPNLEKIKDTIRNTSIVDAVHLAESALMQPSAEAVEALISEYLSH